MEFDDENFFDVETSKYMDAQTGEVFAELQEGKKLIPQTVLRKLFSEIGKLHRLSIRIDKVFTAEIPSKVYL